MSNLPTLVFPDLLLLEDFKGNFQEFLSSVYSVFENNFIKKEKFKILRNIETNGFRTERIEKKNSLKSLNV